MARRDLLAVEEPLVVGLHAGHRTGVREHGRGDADRGARDRSAGLATRVLDPARRELRDRVGGDDPPRHVPAQVDRAAVRLLGADRDEGQAVAGGVGQREAGHGRAGRDLVDDELEGQLQLLAVDDHHGDVLVVTRRGAGGRRDRRTVGRAEVAVEAPAPVVPVLLRHGDDAGVEGHALLPGAVERDVDGLAGRELLLEGLARDLEPRVHRGVDLVVGELRARRLDHAAADAELLDRDRVGLTVDEHVVAVAAVDVAVAGLVLGVPAGLGLHVGLGRQPQAVVGARGGVVELERDPAERRDVGQEELVGELLRQVVHRQVVDVGDRQPDGFGLGRPDQREPAGGKSCGAGDDDAGPDDGAHGSPST
ncbi:hypothetical protein [Nocardioides zeae]|uniref:Uncharacterized protein n=1 Tax=Nocardioides zeae TaxID=1457234 RepID=A0AAJ1U1S8_9ACTN|nr:hypothetical protein [Nocardioides zeae]MDQ1105794.1 hypothetical protein [Nocardioides zeae]